MFIFTALQEYAEMKQEQAKVKEAAVKVKEKFTGRRRND